MVRKVTWRDRLRYRFDSFMSRGTIALIIGLAALSLALVLVAGIILAAARISPQDGEPLGFLEATWASLMRTLDAGTMGGDAGWGFRLVMLLVTLGGIFIVSTLIGILTSGIENKMEALRRGRSRVVESDHTVILGWAPQISTVINELIEANANQRHACIVVLGDRDKTEMENTLRETVGASGRTRIVCRTGSPISRVDLEIASLHTSRAIIVLSPESENPDADVVKTLLAIINDPHRRKEPYHIVGEIRSPRNLEVARLVARGEAELVSVGSVISRIIAQACHQPGLSTVYANLLNFDGDEIYIRPEAALVGSTFGQALSFYENAAVIGLLDRSKNARLNPAMDTLIEAGDQIIAIAADDDAFCPAAPKDQAVNEAVIQVGSPAPCEPERIVILGWNWRAPGIIEELHRYVPQGSTLTVMASHGEGKADVERLSPLLQRIKVTFRQGDTTDRRSLEELTIQSGGHVIVLAYSDHMDVAEADAITLMTLLHLRDIAERTGHTFTIVSEMLDTRNRELAEVARADDLVISGHMTSLLVAQIAENKHVRAVFDDLFSAEGSEIYLKPAIGYVEAGIPASFYTVIEAARRRREVAIGYRRQALASAAEEAYGVVVNPKKSELVVFSPQDMLIVLAEG